MDKVQEAFNAAIKRRDMRCMVQDYEPCCGPLECSHFFTVGSSPSLRFYPLNAWTQCQKHHFNHHNKKEWADVYKSWLLEKHFEKVDFMGRVRHCYIKYTDELKAQIIRLCEEDKLDELETLIETELTK